MRPDAERTSLCGGIQALGVTHDVIYSSTTRKEKKERKNERKKERKKRNKKEREKEKNSRKYHET